MTRTNSILVFAFLGLLGILTACKKDDLSSIPVKPGQPGQPGQPAKIDSTVIYVKAAIRIGEIVYDSIPANLQITSWDSSQTPHHRQLMLTPGSNRIALVKAHTKYQLKLSQWGVADEITFTKNEIPEGTTLALGGSREARKLKMEESFLFASGGYHPNGKALYQYNGDGSLRQVLYYQKKPQSADLKLYFTDRFVYESGRVSRINRIDDNGATAGFTEFTYTPQGKVINMHQESYGRQTYAAVEYGSGGGFNTIDIDYVFDNGNAMTYSMKFKGGNKVQDGATSSTGGGEGGTYGYDSYINPYAHMNMPDLYLSKLSKNNLISQQKGYSGSIPSGEPYKFEYSYDNEGYPVEVEKSYKSYVTGEHLYKIKTVFTY